MPSTYPENDLREAVGGSPLDQAGRAALGGMRWSGAAALLCGALLLVSGLQTFPAVIALAGILMAVWVAIAAFIGLMRGLAA
jgi:hypothetical protein